MPGPALLLPAPPGIVEGREVVRACYTDIRARLLHPRGGDGRVVVAAQRLLDQRLQDRILERLPPRRIRERHGLCRLLAAERWWLGDGGTLVIGTDRATGEQRGRDDHPGGSP